MSLASNIIPNIQAAYISLLERPADPDGLQYWTEQVTKSQSAETVITGILQSDEFKKKQLQPTHEQFLNSVYANLFNRAPDADGKAYYLEQLKQNQSANFEKVLLQIIQNAQNADNVKLTSKLKTADEMTKKLDEQKIALQQEQFFVQQKAMAEAMKQMSDLIKNITDQASNIVQIDKIIQDSTQKAKPEPIYIEVPGPTKIVEVPGTVGMILGDGIDKIDLGNVTATITISVNTALEEYGIRDDTLDVITGFGSDDKISLAFHSGNYAFISFEVDELDDVFESEFTDAIVFAYHSGAETSWLVVFDDEGYAVNGVELVGLGDGDFTSSNLLSLQ
ncbi:protein of unknown function [Devosia crocina]|uniref:DUF4214 domain-containing protein n=1 Tax=Devosia crocina TaxID=429728 RepID=A0A1I7NCG2_9HYPH|nr:DUF4214 domain-containing protein [Devosia crocina]SFV32243.1 protein of unknown function [Devosia crocina]